MPAQRLQMVRRGVSLVDVEAVLGKPLVQPAHLRVALGLLRHFAVMANDVRFFAPPYWKIDQCAERAARDPPCPWAERRLGPALSFRAR